MMKGNNYRSLDLFFPFVLVYTDTFMEYEDEAPLRKVHVQYTDIKNRLISDNYPKGWSTSDLAEMNSAVYHFKKVWLFSVHIATVVSIHCIYIFLAILWIT